MGVVYRGYDPVLDREIALKTVELPQALDPERRKRFLDRFLLEAKIAGKLIHPNIVVTHDAATDETTETPFIAMELIDGESLEPPTVGTTSAAFSSRYVSSAGRPVVARPPKPKPRPC